MVFFGVIRPVIQATVQSAIASEVIAVENVLTRPTKARDLSGVSLSSIGRGIMLRQSLYGLCFMGIILSLGGLARRGKRDVISLSALDSRISHFDCSSEGGDSNRVGRPREAQSLGENQGCVTL